MTVLFDIMRDGGGAREVRIEMRNDDDDIC